MSYVPLTVVLPDLRYYVTYWSLIRICRWLFFTWLFIEYTLTHDTGESQSSRIALLGVRISVLTLPFEDGYAPCHAEGTMPVNHFLYIVSIRIARAAHFALDNGWVALGRQGSVTAVVKAETLSMSIPLHIQLWQKAKTLSPPFLRITPSIIPLAMLRVAKHFSSCIFLWNVQHFRWIIFKSCTYTILDNSFRFLMIVTGVTATSKKGSVWTQWVHNLEWNIKMTSKMVWKTIVEFPTFFFDVFHSIMIQIEFQAQIWNPLDEISRLVPIWL